MTASQESGNRGSDSSWAEELAAPSGVGGGVGLGQEQFLKTPKSISPYKGSQIYFKKKSKDVLLVFKRLPKDFQYLYKFLKTP